MNKVTIFASDAKECVVSMEDATHFIFNSEISPTVLPQNFLVEADHSELEATIVSLSHEADDIAWGFVSEEEGKRMELGPLTNDGKAVSVEDLADMMMWEACDIADKEDLETTDDIAFDGILRDALIEAGEKINPAPTI